MRTALPVVVHLGLQVPFSYICTGTCISLHVHVFQSCKSGYIAGGKECVFWSQTICVVIKYVIYHTKVLHFDHMCRGILSGFKPTA